MIRLYIAVLILLLPFCSKGQDVVSHQQEKRLNDLWDQATYWEKIGDLNKVIEYKEELVDVYRKYFPAELPQMLRNIASSYVSLPEPKWEKSNNYLNEALSLIPKYPRNDDNLTLYYNCLGDMVGDAYQRNDYLSILNSINKYSNYLFCDSTIYHKDEIDIVKRWKKNTISLLNDSCQKLQDVKKIINAHDIMSNYVNEFISYFEQDIWIEDIAGISFVTIWQYAEIEEKLRNYDRSLNLRELAIQYMRNHIVDFKSIGFNDNDLWKFERYVANKNGEIGNHDRDVKLSQRIVDEVRMTKDSKLLFEKLVDLGVSYDEYHTTFGRESAMIYLEEALNILGNLPDSIDKQDKTMMVLELLASEYVLCSQYTKAINLFNSYQNIIEKHHETDNNKRYIEVLRWKSSTLHHLNYSIKGSREEAKRINNIVLNHQKKTYGEESIQYLTELRTCSFAYQDKDSLELESLFTKGYLLWQKIEHKEQQPEYASFLSSFLCYMYRHKSIDLYKPIEEELEHLCSSSYIDYHTIINYFYDRSVNEYNLCQYKQALEHIKKAEIACLSHINSSEMNEKIAQVFNHESRIYYCMNELDFAKEYAYKAYSRIELFQNENLLKSEILYSLSYLMDHFGEIEKAMKMSIEAFNVRYKCEGNSVPLDVVNSTVSRLDAKSKICALDTLHIENFIDNPQVVDLLITKAEAHITLRQYDLGEDCLLYAKNLLEIHKSKPYYSIGNRINLANSQISYYMGMIAFMQKDYYRAIVCFNEYRTTLETDEALLMLCSSYALVGDSVNFKVEAGKMLEYIRKEISEHFVYLSDHEREIYMSRKLSYALNEIESFVNVFPSSELARSMAFNAVLLEKGLALSSTNGIQKIMDEKSIDNNYLLALKKQLGLTTNSEERLSIQIKIGLEEQNLQKSIKESISGFINDLLVNFDDIRHSIDNESAIVEFIKIPSLDISNTEYTYGALILTKEMSTPIYINLGREEHINNFKLNGSIIYYNDNNEAFNTIWSPIIRYIEDKRTIYFSPTGLLHLVNLELIGEHHTCDKRFVRLTSSRNLRSNRLNERKREDIVLFGGLCYDCEVKEDNNDNKNYIFPEMDRTTTTRSGISYLPGSLEEIIGISKLALSLNVNSVVFSGDNGSEANYKKLSGTIIPILHLSTHGFSLENTINKESNDPMRRCGLLLSSSQQAWNGIYTPKSEDGILLGEEIASVRLQENEIVVLSACESALGEISSEGVWGLQRAFKKAGAKSLLMSLWKVDDEATKIFMVEFYRNYLSGVSKHESLRIAQMHVRNYRDENGVLLFKDPYYWAGFIMLD